MKKIMILFFGLLTLSSCLDKKEIDGKWDDIIKLSTKNVELTHKMNSVTITTKGDWWWIDAVSFENSIYSYYDNEDINLESDSYSIIEEEFLIKRRDKNTLFIKLNENNTGKERVMNITFEAGDYFDYVTIKQAAN
ncbi:hypothetical protein [Thalassobellus citreus]|uniref:hypothetical protein n=1 Tax=Thalassobellus citreus TaxID=3367752 RepID=UPI00379C1F23